MNCLQTISSAVNVAPSPANGARGAGLAIAAIGSGGKTTLLRAFADEAVALGKTAILATTTHFLPFDGVATFDTDSEFELKRQLERHRLICAAIPTKGAKDAGKLGPSKIAMDTLAGLPDYLLIEADGSKRLPLKAHAEHEPVVPSSADIVILVLGASAFGQTVEQAAHRCELFCERAHCQPQDTVTPELAAAHIKAEMEAGLIVPNLIIVNQAEAPELIEKARGLKGALSSEGIEIPLLAGSVRKHALQHV